MSCPCIKKDYYPRVYSLSNAMLLYTDCSVWMADSEGKYPFEISGGGMSGVVNLECEKDGTINITKEDLGFTDCIPDDVYCIKAKTCGETFVVYRLFDGNAKSEIDRLVAKGDERYIDLKRLNERIRVLATSGDIVMAKELMEELEYRIKKITCGVC